MNGTKFQVWDFINQTGATWEPLGWRAFNVAGYQVKGFFSFRLVVNVLGNSDHFPRRIKIEFLSSDV